MTMRRWRHVTDDAFELALLDAANDDAPDEGAAARAAAAAVATAAVVGGVATASGGTKTIAAAASKWLMMAAVIGTGAAGFMQLTSEPPSLAATGVTEPASIAAAALPALPPQQAPAAKPAATTHEAGDSEAGDSEAGDSEAGDSEAGDSKAGDSKPGAGAHTAKPTRATKPKAATAASKLNSELGLLDRVRKARAAGNEQLARQLLAQYQRQHKSGMLAREAEVLRIESLLASGKRKEAKNRARAFLARHPNDPHASRMRRVLSN